MKGKHNFQEISVFLACEPNNERPNINESPVVVLVEGPRDRGPRRPAIEIKIALICV